MTVPLLQVRDLSVDYVTGNRPDAKATVLRDLSLSIAPGEVLGLIGASGSGKSATALALMRLIEFDGGRITAGQAELTQGASHVDLLTAPPRTLRDLRGGDIAMIFQDPTAALNPVRSIGAQLVEAICAKRPMSRAGARTEATTLLQRVGLSDPKTLNVYPHMLSGGMCQRVMIAMALAGRPRLLIADEPTTALDVMTQADILSLLDDLRHQTGLAILLVTHDISVIRAVADRVAVMEQGQIVETGPARDLLNAPQTAAARALIQPMTQTGTFRPPPANPSADPVLRVTNLHLCYPARGTAPEVLHDISLHISPGETLALVGQSGSGKTTLGRACLRLIDTNSGAIHLNDQETTHLHGKVLQGIRSRMQMVFQDPLQSLDPRRTLAQQVEDPLRNIAMPADQRTKRAAELFDMVGLPRDLMPRRPRAVSGGQRQRAAIARALALSPDLLVADEPLAALDPHLRDQMMDLLIRLQNDLGLACLFISHDMNSVSRIAHRIAVMYRGRIVEQGPVAAIFQSPQHPYTQALLAVSRGDVAPQIDMPGQGANLSEYEITPGHFVLRAKSA